MCYNINCKLKQIILILKRRIEMENVNTNLKNDVLAFIEDIEQRYNACKRSQYAYELLEDMMVIINSLHKEMERKIKEYEFNDTNVEFKIFENTYKFSHLDDAIHILRLSATKDYTGNAANFGFTIRTDCPELYSNIIRSEIAAYKKKREIEAANRRKSVIDLCEKLKEEIAGHYFRHEKVEGGYKLEVSNPETAEDITISSFDISIITEFFGNLSFEFIGISHPSSPYRKDRKFNFIIKA